ncbi:MAG TPA: hypothetical protein VKH41_14995 [Myxococcota bacterium]|nr:hypothetical protein [Myxococcota bacterium]
MKPIVRPAAIAGLLALACASRPPEVPEPLLALMNREVQLPPAVDVATSDGALHARVAGRLTGDFAKNAKGYLGTFAIGTQTPVMCQVFDEAKDPASALVAMSDSLFTEIAGKKKVEDREILGVDAGHTGADPYLGVDWIAKLDGAAHQIKQKVGNRGARSLYCVHDEPGYAASFDRFFAGFLASLEEPGDQAPMQYRDVAVLKIAGNEVGFQTVRVLRMSDGNYRTVTQSSLLVPASSDQLLASDDYSSELSRPDGSVISEMRITSDGKDLTQLELSRAKGTWEVKGKMQGKDVSERFAKPEALVSALDENRRMLRVAHGTAQEQHYFRWLGALSPGKPLEHLMQKTGESSVRIAVGSLQMDAEVDDRSAARGSMKIGRMQIDIERTYVDGSL